MLYPCLCVGSVVFRGPKNDIKGPLPLVHGVYTGYPGWAVSGTVA